MKIQNRTFDEERALYNLTDSEVENCIFAGPADGESAMKEARNISVSDCIFSLRYPLWHVTDFRVTGSKMDETCRAPLWYCRNGKIENCDIDGVKAVRECLNISIVSSRISSVEFGWKSDNIILENTQITSEYLFLDSKNITLKNVDMSGKYSFQYVENLTIDDSRFNTKDAFWHVKNATVRNSVLKGEYLGWYSDGLTLINCKIIGTQPLCYCRNLKLVNCEMEDADLSFEYSDTDADIKGNIVSVKNPRSGVITADSVGEIITDSPVIECSGKVVLRNHE